jgi:hypothetical protein
LVFWPLAVWPFGALFSSGGKGIRTPDIQLAKLALYQLSYTPVFLRMLEPKKPRKTKTVGGAAPARWAGAGETSQNKFIQPE